MQSALPETLARESGGMKGIARGRDQGAGAAYLFKSAKVPTLALVLVSSVCSIVRGFFV
jgi:hypothetical protein